ncbi:MAG: hypothetical protein EBU96_09385, partial [Actinobacteria bacterium]|nr:hypothetical protein [Actinomycetota bacterium]
MDYIDRIAALGACSDAIEWLRAARQPDLAAAWAACPRAEWMLWLTARCAEEGSPEHRALVAAAADCAATALDFAPGAARARSAVEAAQAWAQEEVSTDDCQYAGYDCALVPYSDVDAATVHATKAAAETVDAACLPRADKRATAAAAAAEYAETAGADPAHLLALV